MRILLVDTTVGGDLIGGAQTFLSELTPGLARLSHEVHLLSNGEPATSVATKINESGATLHTDILNGAGLVDDATPEFAKWVNELRPDVYVVSVSPDIGWIVLPHLDGGIATLTIGHNDQETFYAPVRHYANFLTRAVGVSEEICRKYRDECGLPPPRPSDTPPRAGGELADRVEWIPYGVEVLDSEPTAHDGPLRLAYVGRFDEIQKRVSDIVRIARYLSGSGIDFVFDLVGDGEEMVSVKRELLNEIADGRVRLHGWVGRDDVLTILRNSDVFVLASAFEGFCIALVESMANGCCPVVTDIRSGNKQLVRDGENGFIVPVGDVDAFVDRIKLLTGDGRRLLEMRRAAWGTGREYSVERMVDNYVACFERAIDDAKANPRTPDPSFPLMPSCRSTYPLWLRRIKARFLNAETQRRKSS